LIEEDDDVNDGTDMTDGEETSPRSRRKDRATKKHQEPRRARSLSPLPPMENYIYEALLDPETSLQTLATEWLASYKESKDTSAADLLNFILKSCGCDIAVQSHDIADPDTAGETLGPIEKLAAEYTTTEYDLISRKSDLKKFRDNIESFLGHLIEAAANDGLLYEDESFMRFLYVWFSVLSGSHLRSFRHSATVVLLIIMTKLCDLHEERVEIIESNKKVQSGAKKSKSNKTLKKKVTDALKADNHKLEILNEMIDEIHTSVWSTRFKDVDPRIRLDCLTFLGRWIVLMPGKFLENHNLRCFGIALSDLNHSIRLDVLDILSALYKRSEFQDALRQFTLRFRPRFLQMAQADSDNSVRKAAVKVLSIIAKANLIEDSDKEALCGLVLDCDPHVRKAAAQFFVTDVESVADELLEGLSTVKLEQYEKQYEDLLPSWVDFKALALRFATLIDDENGWISTSSYPVFISNKQFEALPSRISVASATVLDVARSKKNWKWENLANQLLYDFSLLDLENDSEEITYLQACSLDEGMELVLLDVLYGFISSAVEARQRLNKKRSHDSMESSGDDIRSKVVELFPALLKKFDHSAAATAKVLRLQEIVELEIYRQLHQESAYQSIFDKAIKLFTDASSSGVLTECELLFKKACADSSPFASDCQSKLRDVLEDFSFDIQEKLNETEPDTSRLVESLGKVERLGPIIDIQDLIDTELNSGKTVGMALVLSIRDAATDQSVRQDYVELVVNILRLYAIHKLAALVNPTSAIRPNRSQQNDSRLLSNIIGEIDIVSFGSSRLGDSVRITLKLALCDVLLAVKVATLHADLEAYSTNVLSHIPDNIPESSQRDVIRLFLKVEKEYGLLAGIDLQRSSVDDDLEQDDEMQEATTQGGQSSLSEFELDYCLCELASKILVAASVNIFERQYAERLSLNLRLMSPRYIQVVKEMGGLLRVETVTRKANRGRKATELGNM
jgi:cohesin complex subunit SA-1/2